jgi:hypothetical protein
MKTGFSNHEAERLQFMTQGVNSLLSGITFWELCKSTYDKRFFVIISAFLKLLMGLSLMLHSFAYFLAPTTYFETKSFCYFRSNQCCA